MKMPKLLAASWAILLAAAGSCGADEPAVVLPKEHGWARYHAITASEAGEERIATLTLKSLGKSLVDDLPCRWLESEYVSQDGQRHERRKYLIPERAIESSERPLEEAIKYLQQDDKDAVVSLPPESQAWMATDSLHFPGLLKTAKVVADPRTVTFQGGKLEIANAYLGTYRWSRKGRPPAETTIYEPEYRIWLHPDLPVGFAHAVTTLRLTREGKTLRSWQLDYALQEFGDNAEPAIPEESAPPINP